MIELQDGSELPFFSPETDLGTDRNYTWITMAAMALC